MGFRTVVMLNNDWTHEWGRDPELGRKIIASTVTRNTIGSYGKVVECVHADTQTLVRLDHYTGFETMAHTWRTHGPSTKEDKLRLIKDAAEEMGYRLVKKSAKKIDF